MQVIALVMLVSHYHVTLAMPFVRPVLAVWRGRPNRAESSEGRSKSDDGARDIGPSQVSSSRLCPRLCPPSLPPALPPALPQLVLPFELRSLPRLGLTGCWSQMVPQTTQARAGCICCANQAARAAWGSKTLSTGRSAQSSASTSATRYVRRPPPTTHFLVFLWIQG